jgi:hypothetical protein
MSKFSDACVGVTVTVFMAYSLGFAAYLDAGGGMTAPALLEGCGTFLIWASGGLLVVGVQCAPMASPGAGTGDDSSLVGWQESQNAPTSQSNSGRE